MPSNAPTPLCIVCARRCSVALSQGSNCPSSQIDSTFFSRAMPWFVPTPASQHKPQSDVLRTATCDALRLRTELRTEDELVRGANLTAPSFEVLEQLATVGKARAPRKPNEHDQGQGKAKHGQNEHPA